MTVIGQYVRPDGDPHQGFITLTPDPAAVTALPDGSPLTVTLQTARLDMDCEGYVRAEMLNPHDPTITPGPSSGNPWGYCVRETFQRGPVLGWHLIVPEDVGDGGLLDLAKVERRDEEVVRGADWFPYHLIDASVQASRISPRRGPLLRPLG